MMTSSFAMTGTVTNGTGLAGQNSALGYQSPVDFENQVN